MSQLRRMMMAAAMRKDGNLMGEEFLDCKGKFPLSNKEIRVWRNIWNKDTLTYTGVTYNDGLYTAANGSSRISNTYKVKSNGNVNFASLVSINPNVNSKFVSQFQQGWKGEIVNMSANTNYDYVDIVQQYFAKDATAAKTPHLAIWQEDTSLSTTFKINNIVVLEVDSLFGNVIPTAENILTYLGGDITKLPSMFGDIPVIVHKGNLHYALTKEVRDYAASFSTTDNDVLAKLNEYCCEHPAMIEYINKWKYIIHSLGLGTGYTSWLNGGGSAYIDTGYAHTEKRLHVQSQYVKTSTILCNPFGVDTKSSPRCMHGNIYNTYLYLGDSAFISGISEDVVNNIINYDFEIFDNSAKLIINGRTLESNSIPSVWNGTTVTDTLFGTNKGGQVLTNMKGNISYYRILNVSDNSVKLNFLPYYDSKTKKFGMLDVSADTPKFYGAEPNTGEFTWSLTDESGNEVLSFKETDLPKCLVDACFSYGISTANMESAYDIDNDIVKSFNGVGRSITNEQGAYIEIRMQFKHLEYVLACFNSTPIKAAILGSATAWEGFYLYSSGDLWYDSTHKIEFTPKDKSILEFNGEKVKIDDIETTYNYTRSQNYSRIFYVGNNANNPLSLYNLKIILEGISHFYIPIISNGIHTMVDLMPASGINVLTPTGTLHIS